MIPVPSRDQVLRAFEQFDREMRPHDTENDGDDHEYQQYALEYDGQLYPPRRILSMTSGIPISDLGDAEAVNKVFTTLRFHIVSIADQSAARRRHQVWDLEHPSLEPPFSLGAAVQQLIDAIGKRGFVFEPWQVAAFVTAVRTKPFVILAGVSGTGKSRLPALVAEATRCTATVIPVRPDWTDSSDVLGYVDLQRAFCPGPLLEAARRATHDPDRFHFCVIDEMNLARVEHYLAEVLSRIEGRSLAADGTLKSAPLLTLSLAPDDHAEWGTVGLPPNLAIVGTVNMDESAHGFSRKVLDRAFTLELSEIDLHQWAEVAAAPPTARWPVSAWRPDARPLAERATGEERADIDRVVGVLVQINAILTQAQLQVGYRTRDEIALFVLNAAGAQDSFVTRDDKQVDPLDLALLMKILPRIAGGSAPIRQVVIGLLGFATGGRALDGDQEAEDVVASWRAKGRPAAIAGAPFPRTAARLCLMWDRLASEGFTSYWL